LSSPPESASLRELQSGFARALRESASAVADDPGAAFASAIAGDALPGEARLAIYRNNSRAMFAEALQRTYPVVRRRVGAEFFQRLAREYRAAHPSRRGDLHWVGAAFAAWLEERMAGTEFAWLADLAHLEWACEEALLAADADALPLQALAGVPAEQLGATALQIVPSLRCVSSAVPVWSVWQENQPGRAGRPIDLSLGAEYVIVHCDRGTLVLHSIPDRNFRFVRHVAAGATLAAALEGSAHDLEGLQRVLSWLFNERLVAELLTPAPARAEACGR